MAKSKIMEKIERKHTFSVEGILNVDELQEGMILCEVEDEGEVDLIEYIRKFGDDTVKISIVKKDEEETE
ncbi:hypothetical protein ACSXEK_16355 (plasmid) [Clostridium perfringens]